MHQKIIKPYLYLGIFMMMIALMMVLIQEHHLRLIMLIIAGLITFSALVQGYSAWTSRQKNLCRRSCDVSLMLAICQGLLGFVLVLFISQSWLHLNSIIGLYQLFFATLSTFSLVLIVKDRGKFLAMPFLNALLHWSFALYSLFGQYKFTFTKWALSIYLGLLGINYLFDAFHGGYRHLFHYQHRPLRIPLPMILTLLTPYQLLMKIQKYLETGRNTELLVKEFIQGQETDVEVLIHTGYSLFDRIGHMDFAYKGMVYSFGNHDAASRKFFDTVGKGIVLKVPRDQYIKMLQRHHVTVISFGLNLSASQLESFEEQLRVLMAQTRPVNFTTPQQRQGFIGRLLSQSDAQFFQFVQGQFQTYFIFGTNCVLFVDYVLWKSDFDLMILSGVMTPGSYYDYFNREYQKLDSRVVSRKIYNYELGAYVSHSQSHNHKK